MWWRFPCGSGAISASSAPVARAFGRMRKRLRRATQHTPTTIATAMATTATAATAPLTARTMSIGAFGGGMDGGGGDGGAGGDGGGVAGGEGSGGGGIGGLRGGGGLGGGGGRLGGRHAVGECIPEHSLVAVRQRVEQGARDCRAPLGDLGGGGVVGVRS